MAPRGGFVCAPPGAAAAAAAAAVAAKSVRNGERCKAAITTSRRSMYLASLTGRPGASKCTCCAAVVHLERASPCGAAAPARQRSAEPTCISRRADAAHSDAAAERRATTSQQDTSFAQNQQPTGPTKPPEAPQCRPSPFCSTWAWSACTACAPTR